MDTRGACSLYYQYEIHDKNGKRKRKSRRLISRSFLTAYITLLYTRMVGATTTTLTDTGGSSRTIGNNNRMTATASSGTSTAGLVAGTGTNSVTITDSKLQTQIAHGTSAGQLSYGASVVNLPSSDSTSTSLILTRVFSNGSGGTITIREIGVYVNESTSGFIFNIIRDTTTIALSNGDQLTLNYILKTSV